MADPAIRFRFEYGSGGVRLVSRQPVNLILPPSDNLAGRAHSGFWFELRDGGDRVLYRKVLNNPIRVDHEVFADPGASPVRVAANKPAGEFWVLAPDRPDARSLVLHSSPLDPGRSHEPASVLARFDLGAGR